MQLQEVSCLKKTVVGLERAHQNLQEIHFNNVSRRRAAQIIQRAYRSARLRNLLKDASAREEVTATFLLPLSNLLVWERQS